MGDPGLEVRLNQAAPIRLDAAFECRPGEVLALVGPSGSGKSTILRCIAGLHRPRQGRVASGDDVWLDRGAGIDRPTHARRVGFVFQSYALFPHMSALGNVAAALGHRPRPERDARARALLALVHLDGLEQRRPAALSGGQQQRVAVARALAREPDVLLLDEPFSAVDRVTRRKLYRELASLRQELRMPVILVTHDLEEAALLADRLCILHHGRTLQIGAPAEVMAKPDSVAVARLIDLPNIFAGRVAAAAGFARLDWGPFALEVRPDPRFPPGARVAWSVPSGGVVLHRRDRPSRGERENPIPGIVQEFVAMGENASVRMAIDGMPDQALTFSIPLYVAGRNDIRPGVAIQVSLLAEAIHLMPPESPG